MADPGFAWYAKDGLYNKEATDASAANLEVARIGSDAQGNFARISDHVTTIASQELIRFFSDLLEFSVLKRVTSNCEMQIRVWHLMFSLCTSRV